MELKSFKSLNDVVRNVVTAVSEAKTYKGLSAFAKDESMLDDLEYDLKLAGLSPNDYMMDQKKGTITFKKTTPKLKNVLDQYDLHEEVSEIEDDENVIQEDQTKDLNVDNVEKALKHDCAKHVVHESLGYGVCVAGQHTLEEQEDGTAVVTHYDVVFEDGKMYGNVPVKDLEILVKESHMHTKKKK